jgi:hypothetical protein
LPKKMPTVSKTFSNWKMDFYAGSYSPSKAMLATAPVRSAHQLHLFPIPASWSIAKLHVSISPCWIMPLQVNSERERGHLSLQTMEKLKYKGTDLKLEMKDLKKVEKAVKVESFLYLLLLLTCAPWCAHIFFQICSRFWLLLLQCDVLQNAYRLCPWDSKIDDLILSFFFRWNLRV